MQTLNDIRKTLDTEYGKVDVAPLQEDPNSEQVKVMILTGDTPLGDYGNVSWVEKENLLSPQIAHA